jgi:hypothetical protein
VRAKDLGFFILTYNVDQARVEEEHIVAAFVPNSAALSLHLAVGSDRAERVKLCSSGYIQILNCVQLLEDGYVFIFKPLELLLRPFSLQNAGFVFLQLLNYEVESGILG